MFHKHKKFRLPLKKISEIMEQVFISADFYYAFEKYYPYFMDGAIPYEDIYIYL